MYSEVYERMSNDVRGKKRQIRISRVRCALYQAFIQIMDEQPRAENKTEKMENDGENMSSTEMKIPIAING